MQQRHIDRRQYFNELANTSRKFYIDYLKPYVDITPDTKVLEIGCGEGGNLLPFAELGCYVKGIDLNAGQIENAKKFFAEEGQKGDFCAENFLNYPPQSNESKLFDIVLIHDCIEHIEQPDKAEFFTKIKPLVRENGIVFFAFKVVCDRFYHVIGYFIALDKRQALVTPGGTELGIIRNCRGRLFDLAHIFVIFAQLYGNFTIQQNVVVFFVNVYYTHIDCFIGSPVIPVTLTFRFFVFKNHRVRCRSGLHKFCKFKQVHRSPFTTSIRGYAG